MALAACFVTGLAEEANAGVTLGPRATVIVSKDAVIDAIMRLRLAKGCWCSNMLSSPFLRIAGAGHWPAAWRETARTLGGRYFGTMTTILRKNEIGIL